MPLAFPSRSHGTIVFGFFNIETDLLLLEDLFFFADRFCRAVVEITAGATPIAIEGWCIEDRARIGNLHGAIAGADLGGFIGATYRRWPFPATEEGFRQDPEGSRNRAATEEMIAAFGKLETIPVAADPAAGTISIGGFVFDDWAFDSLVAYVDRGGMPRWRDEVRPDYVTEMNRSLQSSAGPRPPSRPPGRPRGGPSPSGRG